MQIVQVDGDLEKLARAVRNKCEAADDLCDEQVVISGVFPIDQVNSPFIQAHADEATKWQSPVSESTFFTHGQYMDRGSIPGREYLVRELSTKPLSKRALVSLISMQDIVGSADRPIPSFMVLQFGFHETDRTNLLVTAYFRALEVANFLPVNLAEICLNIRSAYVAFPSVRRFTLALLAFRAYSNQRSNNLRRHLIDELTEAQITFAVAKNDYSTMRAWLQQKASTEPTYVETRGLAALMRALEACGDQYPPVLGYALKSASDRMELLNSELQSVSSTASRAIQRKYDEVRADLDRAIACLSELMHNASR